MSLPDILQVKPLPTISNLEIKTEILDPITASNQEVVFQLARNGILDGGSFVSLAARVSAAQDGNAFFPLQTGIYGMVSSVQLTIGSKVVASNEDFGHYATMMRQFQTPEHRAFVEQVKAGNSMDRFGAIGSGRIIPKDMTCVDNANDATGHIQTPAMFRPTSSDATTPTFSVPLSMLLPMMASRQLPLFAIKEHVYLRIQFSQQTHGTIAGSTYGNICCYGPMNGTALDANTTCVPSLPNIKFHSDHLYYDEAIMAQTMAQVNSAQGLSYVYEDLILTNTQIQGSANPTAPAVLDVAVERQIAVSGKTVRNLMISQQPTSSSHNLLGKYFSHCTTANDAYNFRINDNRYYDRDLVNPAMKYNELAKVLGRPLQVPHQLYSANSDSNKAVADGARNQNSVFIGLINAVQLPTAVATSLVTNDLSRASHYIGVDLTLNNDTQSLGNGKRIGVKPIILQYTRKNTAADNAAQTLRVYANIERVFRIQGGNVMVSA
jgi:hypothetical protein